MSSIAYRTCHLCEATCGLELHIDDREIALVRGDRDDVFSHGYLCPKGTAIKHLETDPDRVRTPMIRRGETWHEVTWDEAFAEIDRRLGEVRAAHGNDAVAAYLGNPNAHNLGPVLYNRVFLQALGSGNVYSASTVDQMPKQVSAGLMFGTALSVPVPDVDRTDYLLMLGANPFASNGSLWTAPDLPARLRALRARGGRLVVVDPRRTKTAEEADEHVAIRPATDALFLFALVHVLFAEDLVALGALAEHTDGVDAVRAAAQQFAPELVADATGIDAATIRRIARELAGRAGRGRVRPHRHVHAGVRHARVVAGGRAERAHRQPRPARRRDVRQARDRQRQHRRHVRQGPRACASVAATRRVRGLPEFFGELPVVCLAEEIETPGDGQVRALITLAGNPAVSTPDAERLDRALGTLDFMVSVDIYLNETTRHADVFLPAEPELTRGHYDVALYNLAIRNVANYSPPLFELDPGAMPEWQILLRLAAILGGQGAARRHRRARRLRDHRARAEGRWPPRFQRRRPRRRRAAARARVPARSGTHPRLHAAHRPVRRRLRCRPRRPEPREARGAPARHRPRPAATARARGPAHAERQDRAGTSRVSRRRRPSGRRCSNATGPSSSSSAGATCGRTTRGCTTCRCS